MVSCLSVVSVWWTSPIEGHRNFQWEEVRSSLVASSEPVTEWRWLDYLLKILEYLRRSRNVLGYLKIS
ncbi:hypothetical protein V6N11_071388 [Hibiscus sabdariffa]|uniref:Uncharacterized protein n=1 Tax=Hibiscus sabdariffa TaxID=183260 RepID=A0ABR2U074_9ROSI